MDDSMNAAHNLSIIRHNRPETAVTGGGRVKLFDTLRQRWIPRRGRDGPRIEKMDSEVPQCKSAPESYENERIQRIAMLTPRERELFLLLLEGYTLKESAKQLSVKYSTVNTHMTGIYKKLNVNSRAELIIRYRVAGVKPD